MHTMSALNSLEYFQLCMLLCFVHLLASGGQVLTTNIEDDGTKPLVYAMFFASLAGMMSILLSLILEPKKFFAFGSQAWDDGILWLVFVLAIAVGLKALSFMTAPDVIGALNAVIYIPIVPVAATIMSRLAGKEGPLTWKQILGIAISLSGAILVTVCGYSGDTNTSSVWNTFLGNMLMLVYVTASGCQIVFMKTLVREVRHLRTLPKTTWPGFTMANTKNR